MGLNESVEWGILYRNLQYTNDFCCEKAVAGSRALSNAHSSAYPAPFSSLAVCITFTFHWEVNNRRKTAENTIESIYNLAAREIQQENLHAQPKTHFQSTVIGHVMNIAALYKWCNAST